MFRRDGRRVVCEGKEHWMSQSHSAGETIKNKDEAGEGFTIVDRRLSYDNVVLPAATATVVRADLTSANAQDPGDNGDSSLIESSSDLSFQAQDVAESVLSSLDVAEEQGPSSSTIAEGRENSSYGSRKLSPVEKLINPNDTNPIDPHYNNFPANEIFVETVKADEDKHHATGSQKGDRSDKSVRELQEMVLSGCFDIRCARDDNLESDDDDSLASDAKSLRLIGATAAGRNSFQKSSNSSSEQSYATASIGRTVPTRFDTDAVFNATLAVPDIQTLETGDQRTMNDKSSTFDVADSFWASAAKFFFVVFMSIVTAFLFVGGSLLWLCNRRQQKQEEYSPTIVSVKGGPLTDDLMDFKTQDLSTTKTFEEIITNWLKKPEAGDEIVKETRLEQLSTEEPSSEPTYCGLLWDGGTAGSIAEGFEIFGIQNGTNAFNIFSIFNYDVWNSNSSSIKSKPSDILTLTTALPSRLLATNQAISEQNWASMAFVQSDVLTSNFGQLNCVGVAVIFLFAAGQFLIRGATSTVKAEPDEKSKRQDADNFCLRLAALSQPGVLERTGRNSRYVARQIGEASNYVQLTRSDLAQILQVVFGMNCSSSLSKADLIVQLQQKYREFLRGLTKEQIGQILKFMNRRVSMGTKKAEIIEAAVKLGF